MKEILTINVEDYSQSLENCARVEQISFAGNDIKAICDNVKAYFSIDFSEIQNVVLKIVAKKNLMMADFEKIHELFNLFPESAHFRWGSTDLNDAQRTLYRLDFQIGFIE